PTRIPLVPYPTLFRSGKGYGPILVAREPLDPRAIAEKVVAIPGSHTTAALLLRLYVGDPPLIEVAFDKIPTAVLEGQADVEGHRSEEQTSELQSRGHL